MSELKLVRTETRAPAVRLSDDEFIDRATKLAQANQDIDIEEGRQVDLKAQMKSTMTALEGTRSRLSSVVARREEVRDVLCDFYHDHARGFVEVIRQDTGESISIRPMTEAERQQQLPIEA